MGVRTPSYQAGFYAPERGGRPAYPQAWRGCVGAWNPGLGQSGSVLREWSGRKNNGVLTNGPVWSTSTGRQAISFDATNDYVDLQGTVLTTGAPFSICWWEYITANTNEFPSRICLRMVGTSDIFLVLRPKSHAGYANLSWGRSPSSNTIKSTDVSTTAASVGVWKHFAIAGSDPGTTVASNYRVHEDGLQKTAISGGAYGTVAVNRIAWDGSNDGTTAQLSDVRIYSRALSANEISLLARRPSIAYELAPRKFYSLPTPSFSAAWARRQSIIIGGGLH